MLEKICISTNFGTGNHAPWPGRLPRVQQRGPLLPPSPGSDGGPSEGGGGAGAGGDCSLVPPPSSGSGTAGRCGCVGFWAKVVCATPPPGTSLPESPSWEIRAPAGGRRAQWGVGGRRVLASGLCVQPAQAPGVSPGVFVLPCPHASQGAEPRPEPSLPPMCVPRPGIKATALWSRVYALTTEPRRQGLQMCLKTELASPHCSG